MALPPIGILQGRLTPSLDGRVQFFPHERWEEEFPLAREIGFSAIEILIQFGEHEKHPLWTKGGCRRLASAAAAHSITLPSVHGFFKWRKHGEESARALTKIIPAIADIGAGTLLLSFFDENSIDFETDKEEVVRQIKPLAELAKNHGVRLGLEVEMPAAELKKFISAMKQSAIGVYYDIGNMASTGVDVPAEVKLLGPLIVGVHIKDRELRGETVPLGSGAVDFPETFRALKGIGFHGPYIIQGARHPEKDDFSLNAEYHQYVKNILEKVYAS